MQRLKAEIEAHPDKTLGERKQRAADAVSLNTPKTMPSRAGHNVDGHRRDSRTRTQRSVAHITQELLSAKISKKRIPPCATANGASQIHHVISRSLGGDNTEKNLITLCMYCHGEMHGTHFPERPDWMDAEYTEQVMIEYMADYCAGNSDPWWPFE